MFELTTCAMFDDGGKDCRAPRAEDSPLPICLKHARSVYLFFADYLADIRERTAEQEADFGKAGQLEVPFRGLAVQPSTVYYVRIGNLIKIGTTKDMNTRMTALQPDEVLAIEEGDRDIELARHRQFMYSKAPKGSEYFYPTAELMEHIAKVREADWKPPVVIMVPGWALRAGPCPSCNLMALWYDGTKIECTQCGGVADIPNYPPADARIVRAC